MIKVALLYVHVLVLQGCTTKASIGSYNSIFESLPLVYDIFASYRANQSLADIPGPCFFRFHLPRKRFVSGVGLPYQVYKVAHAYLIKAWQTIWPKNNLKSTHLRSVVDSASFHWNNKEVVTVWFCQHLCRQDCRYPNKHNLNMQTKVTLFFISSS